MADVIALFEDQQLPPEMFLSGIGAEDLVKADKDTLRAILKRQWEGLLDAPTDLDAKGLKEWKAWRGMPSRG
jgi:hypothetical protein